MIVYLEDKAKFRADVLSNRIEEKIQESFRKLHDHRVGPSELASWKNSLGFIDRVLSDDDIPSDSGVAVEYGLPGSGKRIDVMITGTNAPLSQYMQNNNSPEILTQSTLNHET